MNPADLVAALELPASAHVDQRVPKKLLVEKGAPTVADKRRINEGIDEVQWLAALKPTTIGVPAFRDITREYLEIVVLSAMLRTDAQAPRLAELVHRAVPYPVFLIASQGEALVVSLGHKRWSLGETGQTVLDGTLVSAGLAGPLDAELVQSFVKALSLGRQPHTNLYALYQGWIDTVTALLAARTTGAFRHSGSPEEAEARRSALAECARLDTQIAGLRAAAAKERQIARRVELNLELKRLEDARAVARAKLEPETNAI